MQIAVNIEMECRDEMDMLMINNFEEERLAYMDNLIMDIEEH